jgi:hypothetical protein
MENEEFTLTPSLSEAMMANPFKSLLMLGVTFYTGAVVGKKRTDKAITTFGGLVKSGAEKSTDFAKKKLAQRKLENIRSEVNALPAPTSQGAANRSYYY